MFILPVVRDHLSWETTKFSGRFIQVSLYHDLLNKSEATGIKIMTLRLLAIEVYKCVNNFNPEYLNEMFTKKNCPYDLRDTCILERPKAYTTKYGLKSFRNYGAKIWNLLPNNCKSAVSLLDFKKYDQIMEWPAL